MTRDEHRSATGVVAAAAGRSVIAKSCGHSRHVGTCAGCQQAQLARWEAQLSEVERSPIPARSAV